MPIRLIAIDIDGTLLDSRGRLPEVNRDAIVAAIGRGVDVVLATGRSYAFARPVAEPLPEAVMLAVSNGALIRSKSGVTALRRVLPLAIARDVIAATGKYSDSAAVIFDREDDPYIAYAEMDWAHPNRRRFFETNRQFMTQHERLEHCLTEDPIQVMFNGGVDAMRSLRALLTALPAADAFEVAMTEYPLRDFSLLDVMPRGCTKASALAEWARLRGIEPSEVMAVGDNFNDVEMLEFAGVPVIMGNAVEPLRTRGWHVTGTNDDGGLAEAITYFLKFGSKESLKSTSGQA